jgi:hypothetical protein
LYCSWSKKVSKGWTGCSKEPPDGEPSILADFRLHCERVFTVEIRIVDSGQELQLSTTGTHWTPEFVFSFGLNSGDSTPDANIPTFPNLQEMLWMPPSRRGRTMQRKDETAAYQGNAKRPD